MNNCDKDVTKMENEEWGMGNGEWEWGMGNGNGEWEMEIGKYEILVSVLVIVNFGCCCPEGEIPRWHSGSSRRY